MQYVVIITKINVMPNILLCPIPNEVHGKSSVRQMELLSRGNGRTKWIRYPLIEK